MPQRIKNIITRLLRTDLVKVFSLTALSTFIKMLTSLVSTKIVAIIIGPSGVALMGQLTSFITIIMNVASAGINNGVTKYISEFKESDQKVRILISTAFRMILYCSVAVGILMIVLHNWLSKIILLSDEYGFVFIIFGITVLFYAINNLLIAVVNGLKQFKLYTYINIAGSLFGLLFSVVFVLTMGLKGALIATVTYQSVVLIVTLILLRRQIWFEFRNFFQKIDKDSLRRYLKFSMGSIVFIAAAPIMQLLLRGYVFVDISETQAGIWEGMNRISAMYMMVITMSLTVYYIPRMAELHTPQEIRKEIITVYKFLVPLLLGGFLLVYLLRFFIVSLLYTPDFYPMTSLFAWQLLLDFINACSFVLSYLLVAKAMMITYTSTTVIFSSLYLALAYFLLNLQHNVVGIIQGNILAQILYSLTLIIVFRKILFKRYHSTTDET